MPTLDLAIFRACPSNFMLLLQDAPKFTIVQVTDFHLLLLNRTREELVGFGMFECYPPNPTNNWDENSATELLQSLNKVVKTEKPQTLIARYDVFNANVNKYETRFWSIANMPIFVGGKLTYILNTSIDVTSFYSHGFEVRDADSKTTLNA